MVPSVVIQQLLQGTAFNTGVSRGLACCSSTWRQRCVPATKPHLFNNGLRSFFQDPRKKYVALRAEEERYLPVSWRTLDHSPFQKERKRQAPCCLATRQETETSAVAPFRLIYLRCSVPIFLGGRPGAHGVISIVRSLRESLLKRTHVRCRGDSAPVLLASV